MKKLLMLCFVSTLLLSVLLLSACSRVGSINTTGEKTSADSTSDLNPADSTTVETTTEAPASTTAETSTDADVTTEAPDAPRYVTVTLSNTDVYTGNLIQVNAQSPYCYKVASLYTPTELDRLSASELSELGWASLYANKNGNYLLRSRLIYLRTEVFSAFSLMMSNFVAKTGNRDVQVRYGYQLINSTTDAASLSDERVTGLVVELNVLTDEGTFSIDHTSKRDAYYDWFADNCYTYGFIMTGESGYFRYVGLPHAAYMKENNLDLAGYLAVLSGHSFDNPLSVVDASGKLWSVYSVPVSSGTLTDVKISENSVYVISGNNRDGFIVASYKK